MSTPLILLTNDDGIHAPGLRVLAESLADLGEVQVFAPDRERSAVGDGISLHHPLRVKQIREGWRSVDGTPADCVLIAVRSLLGRRPDLVVSGINMGANLGDDVTYSGTVAGAREGMLLDIPSIAVSDINYQGAHLETAGAAARAIARFVLANGLPRETMLNVNVPGIPLEEIAGIEVTSMGRRYYDDEIIHRKDPRGIDYYWVGGSAQPHEPQPGTDLHATANKRVSVTPLQRDYTNHDALGLFAQLPTSLG